MKRPEFSEFTFGYAFTHNFQDWLGDEFVGVPVFPSLIQEGRLGVGYDVAVSTRSEPFLFQFKIPQIVTRRSKYLPPRFGTPYYRMHLEPGAKSTQHESLLTHSRKGRNIFYVASQFDTLDDLAMHFDRRHLPAHCLFVDPDDIGDLDGEAHFLAYETGNREGWLFSEDPKRVEWSRSPEEFRARVREAAQNAVRRPPESREQYFGRLSDELISSIRETSVKLRGRAEVEARKSEAEYVYQAVRPSRPDDVEKLVDSAVRIEDPLKRLAHVATFALDTQLIFVEFREGA